MSDFHVLVPVPADSSINTGLSSAKASTLTAFLGEPGPLGEDCAAVAELAGKLRAQIVTADVGPFRVTGHKVAVASLKRVFASVKAKRPDLYAEVKTAGMLCCRRVRRPAGRPPSHNYSNHSWGMAVDVYFGGANDVQGDEQVQKGLIGLYGFFHAEGWYWGAEFGLEDAMHFEVAEETLRAWHKAGTI